MITLGIIGVVAALTLPALISNYQKHVYVNQLKKSVSVLSQGFTTMMGHDGVTELKDTYAFSGMGGSYERHGRTITERDCTSSTMTTERCKSFRDALYNTFANIEISKKWVNYKYKYLNYGQEETTNLPSVIQFADGSFIFSYRFYNYKSGYNTGYVGSFTLDTNGLKGPNQYGRDIFILYLSNNGSILAEGSLVAATDVHNNGNAGSKYYWKNNDASYNCSTTSTSVGYGCAARIFEEDAMNY